jgi:hypothetical protein
MSTMHEAVASVDGEQLLEQVREIVDYVEQSCQAGRAAHEVEKALWDRVLALGRQALGMFFRRCGNGDEGQWVTLADGQPLRRLEALHPRDYPSVFGRFRLERVVYGTREAHEDRAGAVGCSAAASEGRVLLPASGLESVARAADAVGSRLSTLMAKMVGFEQSVHSLERTDRRLAEEVPAFWEAQPVPPAEQEGGLLVCTADGKGVPMRRGAQQARIEGARPGKGVRPGGKKMALLGSVYTVEPHLRTPQEVLEALFRRPPGADSKSTPRRPQPCFKRVRATLLRDEAQSTQPQLEAIFGWMAQQVTVRNPTGQKPLVLLMDGEETLWKAGLEYLPETRFEVIEVLDLLHASCYVWEAASLFHSPGSPRALQWVKQQLGLILDGKVNTVIEALRRQGTDLSAQRHQALERICGYFEHHAHRMAYDEYLAAGYPIASGVIEGACRCVVNDRMERSGMRWVLDGAHAMLGLRSISLSGLWDEFMAFRIAQESERLYPHRAANDAHMNFACAA